MSKALWAGSKLIINCKVVVELIKVQYKYFLKNILLNYRF